MRTMTNRDLMEMGVKNLFRRRTRTILTVLGVVIGTASIIVMLSLGIGMNKSFEDNMKNFGSLTTVDVYKSDGYYDPNNPPKTDVKVKLDDDTVKKIEAIEGVDAVMAMKRVMGFVKVGRLYANISFIGTDVSKLGEFDIKVETGNLPTAGNVEVLYGQSIQSQFINPKLRNPYNSMKTLDLMKSNVEIGFGDMYANNINPVSAKVKTAGVMPLSNNENDWNAFVDIKAMEKLKSELKRKERKKVNQNPGERPKPEPVNKEYDGLKVKVGDVDKVLEVQEAIKEMGLQANSLADGLEYMKKTTAGIRAMLGGIGAVALFVAALGITNTMVMSIYERTREIGVMKVIGARLTDIKRLFLFEAGLIGFFGGIIGVILSYVVSFILNNTGMSLLGDMGSPEGATSISVIPIWLTLVALLFSTVVGIAAGYYPALRAMRLSALEAIRNE